MIDVRAADGGYVDDAVEALGSSSVFVSPEVNGHADLAARLESQVGDASIGVAVFSDNAALEAAGPDIVAELAARHPEFDTIIVAVGDDLSAGSHVLLPAGEAMRIANESEGSAGSLEAALTETVQTVIAELPADEPATSGLSGAAIGGGIVAVVVVAAVVTTIVAVVRRRSRRARSQTTGPRSPGELPAAVQAGLQTLRAVRDGYAAVAAKGVTAAAETVRDIDGLVENVPELFARLDRKGGESQRGLAEVEYGDKLAKLAAALDSDYLLDILTHPNLWDDPDERAREVREASAAVSAELIDNIRQVNARRALHFQVSLDSLMGGRKELRDWEREFRAVDDGKGASAP